uniref:Ion_trans_2 domain-containing protein n=1 Tax=Syphacia muris TaxID=451379 RepID=A0A0N5AM96_9BILA
MGVKQNILATASVVLLLGVILYLVPTNIVSEDWRSEQLSNELDRAVSYQLKKLREDFTGRAQRAFRSANHSKNEIESLLTLYIQKSQTYYEMLLKEDKWRGVTGTGKVVTNYENILFLLMSYTLTTGGGNISVNSVGTNAILVIFSYVLTLLLAIVIGGMTQFNNSLIRKLIGWLLGLNDSRKNPNKLQYSYMWKLVRREALILLVTLLLAFGGVIAGSAIMMTNQKDWNWDVALIYSQAAMFTSGHTKYIPDPIEGKNTSTFYDFFLFDLHVWMITLLSMFFAAVISFFRSIYNTQWAEISDEEFYKLKNKIEKRKTQRHLDNPKYEE